MLVVRSVDKSYELRTGRKRALSSVSFEAPDGAVISIVGSNGCGKSTLLKVVGGILRPDAGEVTLPASVKHTGYVWQNYSQSLLPWYTVETNVLLPLRVRGSEKSGRPSARELLGKWGFTIPVDAFPTHLSGGQQQMVCLARALAGYPKLLLLDEPFSALDVARRAVAIRGLDDIVAAWQPTVLHVSHDLDEAVLLGDYVLVLSDSPGTSLGWVEVGIPRPRAGISLTDPLLRAPRETVLELIETQRAI